MVEQLTPNNIFFSILDLTLCFVKLSINLLNQLFWKCVI